MKKQFYLIFTLLLLISCKKEEKVPEITYAPYSAIEPESTSLPITSIEPGINSSTDFPKISYHDYVEKVEEEVVEEEKEESDRLLATYSTSLQGSSEERVNNIEIVCSRLNDYILEPNATFSYNSTTGPFGPEDGFEEAPILLSDGSTSEGYGGGVCQLSSTLYNVVKNIENIAITERHHHSKPVSYVPENEDATVSIQSNLDFQFINHNDYPIQFKTQCADNQVTVWAYQIKKETYE